MLWSAGVIARRLDESVQGDTQWSFRPPHWPEVTSFVNTDRLSTTHAQIIRMSFQIRPRAAHFLMSASTPGEPAQKEARVTAQTSASAGRRDVDIRALKQSVANKFGSSSLLRKVIVAESDYLPAEELIGKIGTWLAILREETP